MKLSILHLSDIHIKSSDNLFTQRLDSIINLAISHSANAEKIFVLFNGDIAFSGKEAEYEVAKESIYKLIHKIEIDSGKKLYTLLVPGNHDCNFDKSDKAREIIVNALDNYSSEEIDDSIIKQLSTVQSEYFDFERSLLPQETTGNEVIKRFILDCGNINLQFHLINTAWCSKLNEKQGEIYFPLHKLLIPDTNKDSLNITVFHHPLNWLSQSCYQNFKELVRSKSDFILTGHEHYNNITRVFDRSSGQSINIEAHSIHSHDDESCFGIININTDDKEYENITFRFEEQENIYVKRDEETEKYGELASKNIKRNILSEKFLNKINDLGGNFKNAGSENLKIEDIFVYPHIKQVGEDSESKLIDASELKKSSFLSDCLILEGDEKSGKTTLVHMLYLHFYKSDMFPIAIDGKSISSHKDSDLEKVISTSLAEQYANQNALDIFNQCSLEKKVVFIDGLDESKIKATAGKELIVNYFKSRFKHVILTVGELFELKSLLTDTSVNSLNEYRTFQIQPFGFRKRNELIRRWYSVDSKYLKSEDEVIRKVDFAERNISLVISKNLIPTSPIYLLTLMQSLEAGKSDELNESSLGEYYRFLISHSLVSTGVNKQKLTEYFEYLTQLAWYMHENNCPEISISDFKYFNLKFSADRHTVDFNTRNEELQKAKLISCHNGYCQFRYPYIYYFFKGLFLSDNFDSLRCRDHIEHCFKHLYVRSNANTILFLAHHASGASTRLLIECMKRSISSLFSDRTMVDFSTDEGLNELVKDSPALIYQKTSLQQHRDDINRKKDLHYNGHDGLLETEESTTDLSLVARITTLYKAIEIAGQFLKNQYSKIDRKPKSDLLNEIFSGPLRALDDLYDFIRRNPSAFQSEIEKTLIKKGIENDTNRVRSIAQKIVSQLITMLSLSFLMKPAQAANSNNISEDVLNLVSSNNSVSYKLIRLCILLDTPNDIPKYEIQKILEEAKNNMPVFKLVQFMVLNRLYMYKTTERDMQWIASKLSISIKTQRDITFNNNGTTLLKG